MRRALAFWLLIGSVAHVALVAQPAGKEVVIVGNPGSQQVIIVSPPVPGRVVPGGRTLRLPPPASVAECMELLSQRSTRFTEVKIRTWEMLPKTLKAQMPHRRPIRPESRWPEAVRALDGKFEDAELSLYDAANEVTLSLMNMIDGRQIGFRSVRYQQNRAVFRLLRRLKDHVGAHKVKLKQWLEGPEDWVAGQAALLLGLSETRDPEIIELLSQAVDSPSYDLRTKAIVALGRLRVTDASVLAKLRRIAANDEEPSISAFARRALTAAEARPADAM